MVKFEVSITRRHMYALVALLAAVALAIPVASWASDKFTDVPNSNVFHNDISWLADAGVTLGCNPPTNDQFCPSSNVTREQMAAFMHRLSDNQVVDAATSVSAETAADADMLAGEAPSAYQSIAVADGYNWAIDGSKALTSTGSALAAVTFDAPAPGIVLATASTTMRIGSNDSWGVIWIELDDGTCTNGFDVSGLNPIRGAEAFAESIEVDHDVSLAATGGEAVTSGSHTLTLCGYTFTGAGIAWDAGLTATWMANGTATAGLTGSPGTGAVPSK